MTLSADDIRTLHKYDIRVLLAIERLMKQHQWVPEDLLREQTKFSEKELLFRLGRVQGKNLVKSSSVPYKGYQLVFSGYDALALHSLSSKGTISALGTIIGVGKESEVYEALGFGPVVLKMHRVGQRSFHTIRKNRGFLPEWKHFPWIFVSTLSAQQEFEALSTLHKGGVSVPVPVGINRHVIVMSQVQGMDLKACTVDDPDYILQAILRETSKAYALGYVHGDLSEFNVMTDGETVTLIDWPQWIAPYHPSAPEILERDIKNILTFFEKKYSVALPYTEAYELVVG